MVLGYLTSLLFAANLCGPEIAEGPLWTPARPAVTQLNGASLAGANRIAQLVDLIDETPSYALLCMSKKISASPGGERFKESTSYRYAAASGLG